MLSRPRICSSTVVHFLTQGGVPVRGALWLRHGPVGDALELHVPPGGDCVGVQGLGSRRFSNLPAVERGAIVSQFVERMRASLGRTIAGECPADEAFAESYPGIHDFLGRIKLADGSARSRSKLTIFYDGPVFKASLTEPDAECSAFVTSDSFLGALAALEEGIVAETLDWRRWWSNSKSPKGPKRG